MLHVWGRKINKFNDSEDVDQLNDFHINSDNSDESEMLRQFKEKEREDWSRVSCVRDSLNLLLQKENTLNGYSVAHVVNWHWSRLQAGMSVGGRGRVLLSLRTYTRSPDNDHQQAADRQMRCWYWLRNWERFSTAFKLQEQSSSNP